MTMKIGQVPSLEITGTKDAQHVAVVVATSFEKLNPGDKVRFIDKDLKVVKEATRNYYHGVVDPFLWEVKQTDNFLVFLRPGLTENLRHEFDINIEFEEEEDVADAIDDGEKDEDDVAAAIDDDWCRGASC